LFLTAAENVKKKGEKIDEKWKPIFAETNVVAEKLITCSALSSKLL